jgi:hypothetical protein
VTTSGRRIVTRTKSEYLSHLVVVTMKHFLFWHRRHAVRRVRVRRHLDLRQLSVIVGVFMLFQLVPTFSQRILAELYPPLLDTLCRAQSLLLTFHPPMHERNFLFLFFFSFFFFKSSLLSYFFF